MDNNDLYPELFFRLVNDKPGLEMEYASKMNSFAEKLKLERWTMPPQITVDFIYNNDFEETSDIVQKVIDFYTDNNHDRLNVAVEKSIEYMLKIDNKYEKVVRECYEVFLEKKYIVTSVTLLTIIEGLLSEFSTNKNNIRMIKACRDERDIVLSSSDNVLKNSIWETLYIFIENLYKKSEFESDEPVHINRNWLLHGRSRYELDKNDCIFLFNTVSSLAYALEHK
nr:MAG TPA: hypothetical protein [Caudoviricetes sp.]